MDISSTSQRRTSCSLSLARLRPSTPVTGRAAGLPGAPAALGCLPTSASKLAATADDAEEVIAINLAIVERVPNSPIAYNRLGRAYGATDSTNKAIDAFGRALAIDPTNAAARARLRTCSTSIATMQASARALQRGRDMGSAVGAARASWCARERSGMMARAEPRIGGCSRIGGR